MIQLHEFDPVIYPFKIWICIAKDFKKVLDENFLDYSTNKAIEFEDEGNTGAVTFAVIKKDTRKFGAVIFFPTKKSMSIGYIAHESSHAAKDLFDHIGAEVKHHEPFEYLLEWIAGCCEKVKKTKIK